MHGGGAHAHWWTHVAATFAAEFRVVAIDLSGHGDSGHRDVYALEQWTDEVMAVADDGGIDGPPVVIGHSMGGFVTIATAARHGDRLDGVIVCDSPVDRARSRDQRLPPARGVRPAAHLRDRRRRRRPLPHGAAPGALPRLRDRPRGPPLAAGGRRRLAVEVRPADLRAVRRRRAVELAVPYLDQVDCRLALLRSEHGLVTPDIGPSCTRSWAGSPR